MSRITRIQTKQGHPVPTTAGGARGPFPPELYRSLPVVEEYEQRSGNGGPEIPVEGTAQNNFRPYKWFKCRKCQALVHEPDLNIHQCIASQEESSEEEE
jgi:hypothetical protein